MPFGLVFPRTSLSGPLGWSCISGRTRYALSVSSSIVAGGCCSSGSPSVAWLFGVLGCVVLSGVDFGNLCLGVAPFFASVALGASAASAACVAFLLGHLGQCQVLVWWRRLLSCLMVSRNGLQAVLSCSFCLWAVVVVLFILSGICSHRIVLC